MNKYVKNGKTMVKILRNQGKCGKNSRTFEKDCFCCFFSSFTFFLCKELHNNKDQQFSNYKNVNQFKKNTSLQLLVHCSHKKSFIILVLHLVFSA